MRIREAEHRDRLRLVEMATRFVLTTRYSEFISIDPHHALALVDVVMKHGVIFVADAEREPPYEVEPCLQCYDQSAVHCGDCSCCPRVIGMLALVVVQHPLDGRDFAEEVAWWVEPEHRNGTVGPRLMHHMEGWCVQKRLHMVKMVAPVGSSAADFYERLGYRAVETAWVKPLGDQWQHSHSPLD